MLELANAIAFFIRRADPDAKVTVSRYKRQDAVVALNNDHLCYVEWEKGGARIARRRYERGPAGFDMSAIRDCAVELVRAKAEAKEKAVEAKAFEDLVKQLKDAARLDDRVQVSTSYWGPKKFVVSFTTPDFTGASMVTDWLLGFGGADEVKERPTLAGAEYEYKGGRWSLRDLARSRDFTDKEFDEVVKLAEGCSWKGPLGTVTRCVSL